MDSDDIIWEVIKDLCLRYQNEPSLKLFKRILERVDYLVLSFVHKRAVVCPHLSRIDLDDLYQTALIGLYKGINSVKEEEEVDMVTARFIAYMKSEITQEFPYKVMPESFILKNKKCEVPEETVFQDLEFEFLENIIDNLMKEEVIIEEELSLLKSKFVQGLSYRELAKQHNISVGTMEKRIKDTLLRIRHQFRIRGIEAL